jgi:sec-independent protein translocase protein TatA
MLGLDNPIHIAFILVLLLLVFGAKRLPEMGRSLGTGLRGFKESISGEHDPTAHLTATPSATPMTVTQPVAATVSAEPTPVHVDEVSPARAVPAEPVVTGEPVVEAEPVANRVPVWQA